MKTIFAAIILMVCMFTHSYSQDDVTPCSIPEAKQFDFWVGEWKCEWTDKEGKIHTASNRVVKILGSCVIEENFNGTPAINLIGRSHSVFDVREQLWKQTWVDNGGGYLDFTGKFENDRMILSRTVRAGEEEFMQRMVWYDITADEFMWNWERSEDKGETWQVQWQLNYEKKS